MHLIQLECDDEVCQWLVAVPWFLS